MVVVVVMTVVFKVPVQIIAIIRKKGIYSFYNFVNCSIHLISLTTGIKKLLEHFQLSSLHLQSLVPASPWWWWCRPHPVREHAQDLRPPLGARPASPPTRQAAQPPPRGLSTNPVSVVGMSGQLKRCNESWFGSLQSGQFAAGWLAGSILCR